MTDSLGVWLRRSRETRKLDLDDAARTLRIRRRYLQALEMGDYEALPGPIQARGFLRNYVRFLGLPVEDALARYDAETGKTPAALYPVTGRQPAPRGADVAALSRTGERTWAPPPPSIEDERAAVRANASGGVMRVLLGLIAFFVLVALGSYVWLRFGTGSASPTSPPTAMATNGTAVQPTAETTLPPATPSFPVAADGTVRIRLVPLSHAWVSLSADAAIVYLGIAAPDQVVEASAEEILIVSTGNGGAFQLYVNGTDWGVLGDQGEIVRRAWTPTGETSLDAAAQEDS